MMHFNYRTMFYKDIGEDYNKGHLPYGEMFLKKIVQGFQGCNLPKNSTVLDVGCGTGSVLSAIEGGLPGWFNLIALEPSEKMLECARSNMKNFASGRIRPNVTFVNSALSDADCIEPKSVDLFVMANSVHWLLTTNESEILNLDALRYIAKCNASVVIITHRPNKKDVFFGEFLGELKKHKYYNADAEFIQARNRLGSRDGMVKKLIVNPLEDTQLTMSILFSPEEAASYCSTISPYRYIPYKEILELAKKFFKGSINVGDEYVKTSWLTTANFGKLRF